MNASMVNSVPCIRNVVCALAYVKEESLHFQFTLAQQGQHQRDPSRPFHFFETRRVAVFHGVSLGKTRVAIYFHMTLDSALAAAAKSAMSGNAR